MLRAALGPAIARLLEDPSVVEVMLNPDGRLWIDRLFEGLSDTGERLLSRRWRAHRSSGRAPCRRRGADPRTARISRTSRDGERFARVLPPVVSAPAFAIRKPAVAVFTLEDYVAAGIMAEGQAEALRVGVATRANILVAGGTSTGKTTLTNALPAEVAKTEDRAGHHRGHARAAMHRAQPRCHANQVWRRIALRTGSLVAAPAPRPHSNRRGARKRSPRSEAWGTGHVLRRPYQALRLVVAIALKCLSQPDTSSSLPGDALNLPRKLIGRRRMSFTKKDRKI